VSSPLEHEIQRLQLENTILRGRISGLRAELEYLTGLNKSKRQNYPPGARCRVCGQAEVKLRRWRCPACYMKWRRTQRLHSSTRGE